MGPDRRTLIGGGLLAAAALPAAAAAAQDQADPTEVITLWPGGAPGGGQVNVRQTVDDRAAPPGLRDRAVSGVRVPTLTVFRPQKANGASVMLVPGGAYQRVVTDKEGFEMARWLAARGYTCFVLLYRLPGDGWAGGPDTPLQDAQRAMRLIRAQGKGPVGVLGFSAGGHVAGSLATRFEAKVYAPVDAADRLSARPDVAGLCYPVISFRPELMHQGSRDQMIGPAPTAAQIALYSVEAGVTAAAPPTWLVHAADDGTVAVANSIVMFQALKAAAVPAELHVFEEGHHGFGLRLTAGKPVAAWPDLFLAWMQRHGM